MPLAPAQLEALERLLSDQGATVTSYFRRGLGQAEMDEVAGEFEFSLSAEARLWYSWHDGAEGAATELERSIGGWRPMPLRTALRRLEQSRRITAEVLSTLPPEHRYNPDWKWAAAWLPFALPGHGAALGVDCAVPPSSPSPVYYVEWADPVDGPPTSFAPSLGALIDRWNQALTDGTWRFDKATERWSLHD